MTRNRFFFFLASVALLLPLLTGTYLATTDDEDGGGDSLYKYLAVFTEVLTRVRDGYVESPDVEDLLVGALDGAADALDPFSQYVPSQAVSSYLAAREIGTRYSGLLVLRENGVMYVAGVEKGSPAEKADLQAGDIVAEVNGEATRVMPLYQAQALLAAAPGSRVALKVLRMGESLDLELTLGVFDPPVPELAAQREVAVLRVPGFHASAAAAVGQHLAAAAAAGQSRLVVDVRGSSGGDPEVAYAVAGLFARGELGTLQRRGEALETFSGGEAPIWEGRVVVLTDRGTRGAAEILATVLRQKVAAELVGERTFGHAGRQAEVELSAGGRLFYTDAFYAGPDGDPLTESLLPDLRVGRMLADGGPEGEEGGEGDLVLEKGIDLLLGEAEAALKKAA